MNRLELKDTVESFLYFPSVVVTCETFTNAGICAISEPPASGGHVPLFDQVYCSFAITYHL